MDASLALAAERFLTPSLRPTLLGLAFYAPGFPSFFRTRLLVARVATVTTEAVHDGLDSSLP